MEISIGSVMSTNLGLSDNWSVAARAAIPMLASHRLIEAALIMNSGIHGRFLGKIKIQLKFSLISSHYLLLQNIPNQFITMKITPPFF